MSQSLADAKRAAIITKIADSTVVGSVSDLERYLYGTKLQTASGSLNDVKLKYYVAQGFPGSIDNAERNFMLSKGAVGSSLNNVRLDFYLNVGF